MKTVHPQVKKLIVLDNQIERYLIKLTAKIDQHKLVMAKIQDNKPILTDILLNHYREETEKILAKRVNELEVTTESS